VTPLGRKKKVTAPEYLVNKQPEPKKTKKIVEYVAPEEKPYIWPEDPRGTALRAIVSMDIKMLLRHGQYSFENLVIMVAKDKGIYRSEVEDRLLRYNMARQLGFYIDASIHPAYGNDKKFVVLNLEDSEEVKQAFLSLNEFTKNA
jgi:hypothetical protein